MFLIVLVLEYLILVGGAVCEGLGGVAFLEEVMSLEMFVKLSQLKELPPLLVCSAFFVLGAEM